MDVAIYTRNNIDGEFDVTHTFEKDVIGIEHFKNHVLLKKTPIDIIDLQISEDYKLECYAKPTKTIISK